MVLIVGKQRSRKIKWLNLSVKALSCTICQRLVRVRFKGATAPKLKAFSFIIIVIITSIKQNENTKKFCVFLSVRFFFAFEILGPTFFLNEKLKVFKNLMKWCQLLIFQANLTIIIKHSFISFGLVFQWLKFYYLCLFIARLFFLSLFWWPQTLTVLQEYLYFVRCNALTLQVIFRVFFFFQATVDPHVRRFNKTI